MAPSGMEREEKREITRRKLQSDAVRQEQANPTFQPPAKGAHAAAGLKRIGRPKAWLVSAAVGRVGGSRIGLMQCKALPMTGL
jgi:hypothetical protein